MFTQFMFASPQVCKIDIVGGESLVTSVTTENFIAVDVSIPMGLHIRLLRKPLVTNVTNKRFFASVGAFMMLHGTTVISHVITLVTVEFVISWVSLWLLRVDMATTRMKEELTESFEKFLTLPARIDLNEMLFTHVFGEGISV